MNEHELQELGFADLLEEGQPQPSGEDGEPAQQNAKGADETDVSKSTGDDQKQQTTKEAEGELDIGGRKYKLSELEELLRNAETWRQQLPHFQKLYEQERQRAEQLETLYRQQQTPITEQPPGQGFRAPDKNLSVEELVEYYEPYARELIKNGVLSEDIYAENPALVTHFLHFQKTQFEPLVQFVNQYAIPAVQYLASQMKQQKDTTIMQVSERLSSILEDMAKEPDAAELKDEAVAIEFVTELARMYPNNIEQLTNPEVVRREWVRRNWQKYRNLAIEATKGISDNRRLLASPGGSGVRPAHVESNNANKNWFDDLLEEKMIPTR